MEGNNMKPDLSLEQAVFFMLYYNEKKAKL